MTRWLESQEVAWIENCLQERKLLADPRFTDDEKTHWGLKGNLEKYRRNPPSSKDLQIWLDKIRDGRSWNEILRARNPGRDYDPEAAKSSVRRAYERVERYLVKN